MTWSKMPINPGRSRWSENLTDEGRMAIRVRVKGKGNSGSLKKVTPDWQADPSLLPKRPPGG